MPQPNTGVCNQAGPSGFSTPMSAAHSNLPQVGPEPALALWLLEQAKAQGAVIAILRSATQMQRIEAIAAVAAGLTEVIAFPSLDTLPYDAVAPSAATTGCRARAMLALAAQAAGPRLLLTTAAAMLGRLPLAPLPPLSLVPGDTLEPAAFATALATLGYHADERADEPGDVALHPRTADLFPACALAPVRIELDEAHAITGLHAFDPITQRTTQALHQVILHQTREQPLDEATITAEAAHIAAAEPTEGEAMPGFDPTPHRSAFTLLPGAPVYADPETAARWDDLHAALVDAHATALAAHHSDPALPYPPKPARLAITPAQAAAALAQRLALTPELDAEEVAAPRSLAALTGLIRDAATDDIVIVATPEHPNKLAASLARRGLDAHCAADWASAQTPGLHTLALPLQTGMRRPGLLLVPIGALMRYHTPQLAVDDALRPGDVVVHEVHGAGRLRGLREVDGEERVALEYADGAELLVPTHELDRVWRHGGASLDRIGGTAWTRKREELASELTATAQRLAEAATVRAALQAPPIAPPAPALAAFARRFPYPLSTDQRLAIDAVLADLAEARPMDRLVCGDVGFGKTEVALRAAAAAALAGHQVMVAAPTTVLARQHLEVFRRRFAQTGLRVEGVIGPGDRAVQRDIRRGEVAIIVGTAGLASLDPPRLALTVIDEEQRFGDEVKRKLVRPHASRGVHALVMTATPIPRTLQTALVGLRAVSVIATPPARRQPTRTLVLPWDPVLVRDAVLRERRRGGQSFIVCPRVADVTEMQERLASLVPELQVVVAHGRMKAEALDAAVSGFAQGEGDVLLATNIIEAGLDIPRANLMIVCRADRFGLAQLHQLRGRVGRGPRRGTVYILTEPGARLAAATRRRLETMAALSALGAGVAIAAADLDARGAGELFGDAQAGHVGAVGTELYQHLLAQAIAAQRGEAAVRALPDLRIGLPGCIPAAHVPGEAERLMLYRRLARLGSEHDLVDFCDELTDRFGPMPPPLDALLLQHRLRWAGQRWGLASIEAGPQAVALTPAVALGEARGGRSILPIREPDPLTRAQGVLAALGLRASPPP